MLSEPGSATVCEAPLASVPLVSVVLKVWVVPPGSVTTTVMVAVLVAKSSAAVPALRMLTLTGSAVP